jgi:hypothetical protein
MYAKCVSRQPTPCKLVFYMYEPLWNSSLPTECRDQKYTELIATMGGLAGTIVVYVTMINGRHITTDMLADAGLTLKYSSCVKQRGCWNTITSTANTLEIWVVD